MLRQVAAASGFVRANRAGARLRVGGARYGARMAKKRKQASAAALATIEAAAKALDVNPCTLRRWRQRGAPIGRGGRGAAVVDLEALRAWAVREGLDGSMGRPFGALTDPSRQPPAATPEEEVRAQVEAEFPSAPAELKEALARAELRKREADASLKELELSRRRGELLDAAEVERGRVQRVTIVVRGLEALAHRLARDLAPLSTQDPVDVVRLVQVAVDEQRQAFADEFETLP